jgi:hypothetical protein
MPGRLARASHPLRTIWAKIAEWPERVLVSMGSPG